MFLYPGQDLASQIRQIADAEEAERTWRQANAGAREEMLRSLPGRCLTESFFEFLLRDGYWISRRRALFENAEFVGLPRQAAVRAAEKIFEECRDARYVTVPVEDVTLFLRELAELGEVAPERVQAFADWALTPPTPVHHFWSRVSLAGLLLRFPGLSQETDRRLLRFAEENLTELLGEPGSEMNEYGDDPLFRILRHPGVSVETLKTLARTEQVGLAHDEMLRVPRICSMPEVMELLLPHTDSTRLLALARWGPPSLFKPALARLVDLSSEYAARALQKIPAGLTFSQEELVPLLASDHAELRLQAIRLASSRERGQSGEVRRSEVRSATRAER